MVSCLAQFVIISLSTSSIVNSKGNAKQTAHRRLSSHSGLKHFITCKSLLIFFVLSWYSCRRNRPFQSYLLPRRQNESSCKNHSYENVFFLHAYFTKSNSFLYEKFCTKTRLETEANDNSEMVFSLTEIGGAMIQKFGSILRIVGRFTFPFSLDNWN